VFGGLTWIDVREDPRKKANKFDADFDASPANDATRRRRA